MQIFERFLSDLNLTNHINEIKTNRQTYEYYLGKIDFISLANKDENKFFDLHNEIWCENKTEFFVATFDTGEIHICDSKIKPTRDLPIKNATIDSFNYEENTPKARKYMEIFKKENIDTGECLREIKKYIKKNRRKTVDKDLLENLEIRRNKIIELLGEKKDKEKIAQILIDRCLFVRFLEDRVGRNDLQNILSDMNLDGKITRLLKLFDNYNNNLNGDIFEKGDIPDDIDVDILRELNYIFGKIYIYPRTLQQTLFPYSFKSIPIILISNIYERFLTKEKKKSEGIVFTPENIVDYIIDKIFEDKEIIGKIKANQIKILDPACGSGVFLIKFIERVFTKLKENGEELTLEDKANIILKCLYGIDKEDDALRIAALSIYLKIIENEKEEIIKEKLFGKIKEHFMFPGLKKNKNLMKKNSLFDSVFEGETFDVIIGNPPWGLNFSNREKRGIKRRWGNKVSKYQSSQCFLWQIRKWMKPSTICVMVVNLSNFTNPKSKFFREEFIREYYLKIFVNLSRIKNITFGDGSEPSCILFFTDLSNKNFISDFPSACIEFLTPELSQFSKLTGNISDGYKSKVSIDLFKKNDNLWHIYSLGYDLYLDLIEFIDNNCSYFLDMFKKNGFFQVGIWERPKELKLTKEEFNKKYVSTLKKSENHFPIIDSTTGFQQYFGKLPRKYLEYGTHLDRMRDKNLFIGEKLIITRNWPIRTAIDHENTLYSGDFFIYKVSDNYPKEYLLLFEAILNSTLSRLYFGVKYLLRKEGNYTKINLKQLKKFPIPDLKNKKELIGEMIQTLQSLKNSDLYKNTMNEEKIQGELNNLVYKLYDLDYYSIRQIEHFKKLEMDKRKILNDLDMGEYCNEFVETFGPFIKKDINIIRGWNISDFFGTFVRFKLSEKETELYDHKGLKKPLSIIERTEIRGYSRTKVFQEEKIKFYDNDRFYIYKSNKPSDWTRFMAIKDANEEIELFFKNLGGT